VPEDWDGDESELEGLLNVNYDYEGSECEVWDEYTVDVPDIEDMGIELYDTVGWDFVKKYRVKEG
jgi:hypothetical protein